MKLLFTLLSFALYLSINAQTSLSGILHDANGEPVPFANVALYNTSDSNMVKVETTNLTGVFKISNFSAGNYFLKATFVGFPDFQKLNIKITENQKLDLGTLSFGIQAEELQEFSVVTEREMVEVKPDRTIFNVQGTTNSVGSNALNLLRKAPAVTVDNNDNINVLGRAGVIVYVDGKKLPLSGDDLSSYLKNLTAAQIDRIEIITNPGAKYEAQGNAGIIDIRLKKDKNLGANGTLSSTFTQGRLTRYNLNGTGNYRNKKMNVFAGGGYAVNDNFHDRVNQNFQNGLFMDGINNNENDRDNYNYRLGTDFFIHKNHTIGFLVGGNYTSGKEIGENKIDISTQQNQTVIDSVLVANSISNYTKKQNTYNLNYLFLDKKSHSLTIDLTYGGYKNTREQLLPNIYYNASEDSILTEVTNSFNTPINIDIYTGKIDYEQNFLKGKLGLGTKYGRVETNNSFNLFNVVNDVSTLDSVQSNLFFYTENVYAGYISYARQISKKLNFSAGLRAEQTNATGDLQTYIDSLQEPAIKFNYLNWFPSVGFTYRVSKKNSLAINYGRRINRPNYSVLNPFRKQVSQLSIQKGNPFLIPEIVNNYELGYTLAYKYNFKLAYSKTDNQITRLIGPDETDARASFLSYDNLATQTVWSFNASLPVTITKWWSAFLNLGASYTDNQANYGNGAVVDVQIFNYTLYQQQTFKLPKGFKGEISGYYTSPGVWGGVFKYNANWSLNLGMQRSFLKKKLSVKITANNIFNRYMWKGSSSYNGLTNNGSGRMDSHYGSISLSYNFGNQNVKSRKRKAGNEAEGKRVVE